MSVNHVAVTVTDIKYAMNWYRDILGMEVLAEPTEISTDSKRTDPHLAAIASAIFGPKLGSFLICHMRSQNGVGIELFQFLEPHSEISKDNFEFWKTGVFHVAFTEPKIGELAKKIASNGGKKRTDILELVPGSGKMICFCEDPFGNVIELYSHSYEQFWAGKIK